MIFLLVSNVWCLILFQMSARDEHFRRPVTTTELEEFGRSWAADNSRRKWCWVSETKEQENKIIISTKNTNIVINYR